MCAGCGLAAAGVACLANAMSLSCMTSLTSLNLGGVHAFAMMRLGVTMWEGE